MPDDPFVLALHDVCSAWPALLPPNRVPVSQGVADNLKIARPGGASGYWDPSETPYMVLPTDLLASRVHSAVCFVGPAQTGKTVALGEGWMTHAVLNDPGDMAIFQMTQEKAREYSRQRIDRALRNSPALRAAMGVASRDDNLHDKQFRNGMLVRIAWPTVTNMSSTSYRYVFGTDYDRWDDNIDGEGDGFSLMLKRTTTFLSRGMVAVESSPGRPVTDPNWRPATPHEAPPVKGILGIYNRSDRRRWYWQCPHCASWFEAAPGLSLFKLPSEDQLSEDARTIDIDAFARQYARVVCPAEGCLIESAERGKMNRGGRWLQDGLTIDSRNRVSGTPLSSSIAGFWLGGVAAAYVNWETLIRKQLQGLLEYSMTGSELPLQTTANTDQGIPYTSKHLAGSANDEGPADRPDDEVQRYVVPPWTRFVVASVDVQGGRNARFVYQVHAIGEYMEQQLVDRAEIRESKREGMGTEFAPIDPAKYAEDWDILTERLVLATYRTPLDDREIKVKLTVVDTGGEEGVTQKAYAWWRRLRLKGLASRVMLTKGGAMRTKVDWHVRESMVGGLQGEGDVPLHHLNPNLLKDEVHAGLSRREPGPGFYHFPRVKGPKNPNGWLPQSFIDEYYAEVRNADGVWEQIRARNESLDLSCMIRAGCLKLGADKARFWLTPPSWARPLETNSDVVTSEQRREIKAEVLARPAERAVRRSAYLG